MVIAVKAARAAQNIAKGLIPLAAGGKVAEIAQDAGVNESVVYKWLNAAKSPANPPQVVEVTALVAARKCGAALSRPSGGDCVVRFHGAGVAIPPGFPPGRFRIFIATEPIDFRKGMDGRSRISQAHQLAPRCRKRCSILGQRMTAEFE
jgi:hypothetical protein